MIFKILLNVFSHSVDFLFTFLRIPFEAEKLDFHEV